MDLRKWWEWTINIFKEILNLVEPDITPQEIIGGNKVISAAERLTLTLRFFSHWWNISVDELSIPYFRSYNILHCKRCLQCYCKIFSSAVKVPSSEDEWLTIADKFESRWQYPNAIGAIDGKHVVIRKPSHGGSHYYNHKHSHSIILTAIAGPSCECLYAEQTVELMMVVFGINVDFQMPLKTTSFLCRLLGAYLEEFKISLC